MGTVKVLSMAVQPCAVAHTVTFPSSSSTLTLELFHLMVTANTTSYSPALWCIANGLTSSGRQDGPEQGKVSRSVVAWRVARDSSIV